LSEKAKPSNHWIELNPTAEAHKISIIDTCIDKYSTINEFIHNEKIISISNKKTNQIDGAATLYVKLQRS
jgi:hypothetical protein